MIAEDASFGKTSFESRGTKCALSVISELKQLTTFHCYPMSTNGSQTRGCHNEIIIEEAEHSANNTNSGTVVCQELAEEPEKRDHKKNPSNR